MTYYILYMYMQISTYLHEFKIEIKDQINRSKIKNKYINFVDKTFYKKHENASALIEILELVVLFKNQLCSYIQYQYQYKFRTTYVSLIFAPPHGCCEDKDKEEIWGSVGGWRSEVVLPVQEYDI